MNADFFLMGVVADFSRIGDASTPCLKHPLKQFVFIFEEATAAVDVAFGIRDGSRFYTLWGDVWKDVTSRPRLR